MSEEKVALVGSKLGQYPDFPKKGIKFFDIFGVFRDVEATAALRDVLVARVQQLNPLPEVVVALDARGFLLGPLVALQLGLPFVPVRKRGKLPGACRQVTYQLEYGQDTLEIQDGSIAAGRRVLIVDDLLATGGSMSAAVELVRQLGAAVCCCLVVIELPELRGRDKVSAPVVSILER